MTSLSPGVLFHTSGFNRMSTPAAPDSTPEDIANVHEKKQSEDEGGIKSKAQYKNENPWPRDSPVAMVYDVENSSTRMILLNNKNKNGTRLRGQGPLSKGSLLNASGAAEPNPNRHFEKAYRKKAIHDPCLDSSSPYYEAPNNTQLEWKNKSQRPPWKPGDGSVNTYRHISCRTPSDPRYYSMESRRPRTTSSRGRRYRGPLSIRNNYYLNHPNLTNGQQLYLWSMAHVYSVSQMKDLKQRQYLDLLWRERSRGFFTDQECQRYERFLRTPRCLTSQDYMIDHGRPVSRRRAATAQGRLQDPGRTDSSEILDKKSDTKSDRADSRDGRKSAQSGRSRSVIFDNEKENDEEHSEKNHDNSKTDEKSQNKRDSPANNISSHPDSRSQSRASRQSSGHRKGKGDGRPPSSVSKGKSKSRSQGSASSKRSQKSSRSSTSNADSTGKGSKKSLKDEKTSTDPDTSDKQGSGPTHVNVEVEQNGDTPPESSVIQEPDDREPNDADKLEY